MRPPIVLAIALVLAGCVGGGDAPAEAAAAAQDAPEAAVEAVDEAPAPAAPAELTFSYAGKTPEGVCSAVGCQWVQPGAEAYHPIAFDGHATKLVATVTYANVKPGMEFYIGLCLGTGASEDEVTCRDYTTGASPFTVEFDLADHAPGQGLALSAGALNGMSTLSGVLVFTASDFEVEGALALASAH